MTAIGSHYPFPTLESFFNVDNFPSQPPISSQSNVNIVRTDLHLSGNLIVDTDSEVQTLSTTRSVYSGGLVTAQGGILSNPLPSVPSQLVNKLYGDSNYAISSASLPLLCNTLTANIISSGDLVTDVIHNGSITIQSGNVSGANSVGAKNLITSHVPSASSDAVNKNYANAHYVSTAALAGSIACTSLTSSGLIHSTDLSAPAYSSLGSAQCTNFLNTATSSFTGLISCGSVGASGTITSQHFSSSHSAASGNELLNKTYMDTHYIPYSGSVTLSSITTSSTATLGTEIISSTGYNLLSSWRETGTSGSAYNNLTLALGPSSSDALCDISTGYVGAGTSSSVLGFDCKPLSGPNGGGTLLTSPFVVSQSYVSLNRPYYAYSLPTNHAFTIDSSKACASSSVLYSELFTLHGIDQSQTVQSRLDAELTRIPIIVYIDEGPTVFQLYNVESIEFGSYRAHWSGSDDRYYADRYIRRSPYAGLSSVAVSDAFPSVGYSLDLDVDIYGTHFLCLTLPYSGSFFGYSTLLITPY